MNAKIAHHANKFAPTLKEVTSAVVIVDTLEMEHFVEVSVSKYLIILVRYISTIYRH